MPLKTTSSNAVPAFLAMAVMNASSQIEATGADVVHLEVGQPSSPPPEAVSRALTDALAKTATHGYSLAFGETSLRRRIAAHYGDFYGVAADPDRIAVTPGSSLGFALAFLAAFDRGDRIALATPGYPAYRNLMLALGIEPVNMPARATQGWVPDLEALGADGSPLPDGILLASPANPTGVVMSDDEVKGICEWCHRNGVRLIMDEIYHGLTFGPRPATALSFSDSVIVVNSFSKYFCMTGWRVGWAIFPPDLMETVERLAQNLYIGPPRPMQAGALAAFDDYAALNVNVERYRENCDILIRDLPDAFLGEIAPSDGAFYLYADISNLGMAVPDSIALAEALLREAHVACTPGVDFDRDEGHRHLRLSYAGSTQDMKEASRRINDWLPTFLASR
ncbi:MAG: aminotransferase class I/II-fold pyridoxal phosphate-dependent enzyme [Pseudomonadota bacterium]|nr:aminotransferase class I/II-fold pyridoxal phosphate-dependent enzyme [Pseudomonadota bacterium]